ncbi:MAG: endonuclease/exonuclease/phosphatase family protein [Bacteroidales bacterium]|nr:endonuclease/exonuclease/phosphatase family protein [Bacteroidales bacterium]
MGIGVQHVSPFRVVSWNVENLFDTVHDVGFNDNEFLPGSERHWNSHRYWQKLNDIARVLVAVSDDDGRLPDLVGLCEVENDSVIHALTRRSLLRRLTYDYVVTHSEDERGVDVALLYAPASFRLCEHRSLRVPSRAHGLRATRDILYAKGLVLAGGGVDTLHVFVAHLPSRVSGQEGDRNRMLAANTLWQAVDSVQAAGASKIVVMGDFNADANDPVFRKISLQLTDDRKALGSYCFRGFWQWIDHILVSPEIASKAMARPLVLPWLVEENRTYGGIMPKRTFRGVTYHGGVSDHLPLVLDLKW